MKFADLNITIEDDQVVLSQAVIDNDGDVRRYDITIPPEQAILVGKEIWRLADNILDQYEYE